MAKKRRSKVRKVITLLVTASLVAGGGYVGYQKYTETKAAEPSGQSDTESISAPVVKTAQATKGTIASTVVGSGTLSDGDSEDVTIPTGITIDQVLVESGDTVKKGDALATVDQTSLASEISSLTDSISSIDEELEDLEDEDDDDRGERPCQRSSDCLRRRCRDHHGEKRLAPHDFGGRSHGRRS